jgi:hypothetical protein
MATTEQPPAPADQQPEPDRFCPSCGAAYEPLQEYCLDCGTRLPVNQGLTGVLASAWQRRLAWYPGDWIWPTLAFLILTLAATGVTVAVAAGGGHKSSIANQATNDVTVGPGATQGTVAVTTAANTFSAPEPTITTGPLPTAPGSATGTTPTTPAPKPNPNALAIWPAGKSGFTVVLESIPVGSGLTFARQRARRAKQAGLPQVGVLDSSAYSSLHPGYYVVFSGVYGSEAQASAAAATAHARGYADAFPRPVTK